jgi:hypothetical protein
MHEAARSVEETVEEIRRYLFEHPNACDTLEGVRVWWLRGRVPDALVQQALNALVARGLVERRRLPGGGAIYAAAQPRSGTARDL